MSGYTSMLQEVVEGLSRRGHSIEDRGPDWVLVEDENGRRFKIGVGEQVEGSTPIAPAQCEHNIAVAGAWLQCQNTPDHDGLHISGRRRWRTGGTLEPAGEVVSVPPPGEADVYLCSTCMAVITFTTGEAPRCPNCPPPAAEPASVPPPVDALLKLIDEFGREAHAYGLGDDSFGDTMTDSWKEINSRVRALWAAGVEEGRRQLDADIHASVFTSARLAATEAGFGPVPESVTVSYERRASAYEEGIYDAGVAEGRRQATEERTEEERGDGRG